MRPADVSRLALVAAAAAGLGLAGSCVMRQHVTIAPPPAADARLVHLVHVHCDAGELAAPLCAELRALLLTPPAPPPPPADDPPGVLRRLWRWFVR